MAGTEIFLTSWRKRADHDGKTNDRNPLDGAVQRHKSQTPRCGVVVPGGRLLRNLRAGCGGVFPHSGHCAHQAQRRAAHRNGDGRFSVPCHRHLSAQAGAGRPAGSGVRPTGRPETGQKDRQTRRNGARHPRGGDERSGARLGTEQLPGGGAFWAKGGRRSFPGRLHRGVPRFGRPAGAGRQTARNVFSQRSAARAADEGPLPRGLRHLLPYVHAGRLGFFREFRPGDPSKSFQDPLPQGLRHRPDVRRYRRRRGGDGVPAPDRAQPHRPYLPHSPYPERHVRVARSFYSAQPGDPLLAQ